MGVETYCKIINNTYSNIDSVKVIKTGDDFSAGASLDGQKIPKYSELTAQVSVPSSKSLITLEFEFQHQGLKDVIEFHQQCVNNGCCPGFKHLTKTHLIEFKKDVDARTTIIIITNTKEQIEDKEADDLYFRAKFNMINPNNYPMVKAQLEEALKLVKSPNLKKNIEINLDAITNILLDDDAKHLNNEAVMNAKNENYTVALYFLLKAEESATHEDSKKTIKKNKGQTLYELAKECYETAWTWDNYQKRYSRDKVSKKFEEAKNVAEEAKKLIDEPVINKLLELIELKMAADKELNEGEEIQIAAFTIYEKITASNSTKDSVERKSFTDVRKKYEEVLGKYRAAGSMYEQGLTSDPKFEDSLEFVKERMKIVMEIVDSIIKADVDNGLPDIDSSEQKEIDEFRSFISREKPETVELKNISSEFTDLPKQ